MGQRDSRPDFTASDTATLATLFNVPVGLRKWGMMITVYADAVPGNNITWYLKYNQASTDKSDNNNWVDASTVFGGGGGGPGSMVIKSSNFDASAGNFPLLGAGVSKGWVYIVGTAGTINGVDLVPGAILIATVDNPGNTWAGGWNTHQ